LCNSAVDVLDSLVSRHVHVTGSGSQNAHCGDIRQQVERSAHVIVTDSSLCRTRQPAWSPVLIATTTPRRFLLACTGFQCASESSTRRRCLRGSACTMQPLAVWLTCAHSVHRRQQLRFTASGTLLVPCARTATGQRSFAINGPRTWNSLPADLRTPDTTLSCFKRHLKAHLFQHSAVVYADAGRWAQHRSSRAVVTV